MFHFRRGAFVASLLFFSLPLAASAQQAPAVAPPAASAVPALAAPEPPATQLAAARDLVVASGMARSFGPMVPELAHQIPAMLTRTRPELAKDLGQVMTDLQPEFDKKGEEMVSLAAHIYARSMSEQDLRDAANFFNSPAGKQYVALQPKMLDELVVAMQAWTQDISNFMMKRVHDEMAKKGHQF